MTALELSFTSPRLLEMRDLEVIVPGTFDAAATTSVRIAHVHRTLDVLASKQRPRKLKIRGSDGLDCACSIVHADLLLCRPRRRRS